jgi:hypothetical protein
MKETIGARNAGYPMSFELSDQLLNGSSQQIDVPCYGYLLHVVFAKTEMQPATWPPAWEAELGPE